MPSRQFRGIAIPSGFDRARRTVAAGIEGWGGLGSAAVGRSRGAPRVYDADTSQDGQVTIEMATRLQQAVIVMSLLLPTVDGWEVTVDGWEVTRIPKSERSTRSIQILVFTGCTDSVGHARAWAAGCDAILTKRARSSDAAADRRLGVGLAEALRMRDLRQCTCGSTLAVYASRGNRAAAMTHNANLQGRTPRMPKSGTDKRGCGPESHPASSFAFDTRRPHR